MLSVSHFPAQWTLRGEGRNQHFSHPRYLCCTRAKRKIIWEHCCRDQKPFSTGSDLVLSFLLEGKKALKGTLSKLLGLKIDLPWQCSHLDGLGLRSEAHFPHTHQSFPQSGSTSTTQPRRPPSPHNLFWDTQVCITYNWQGTVVPSKFLFYICICTTVSYPSKKFGIFSLSKLLDICCYN